MDKDLLQHKIFNEAKALAFGLRQEGTVFTYEQDVMAGQFRLCVTIGAEGKLATRLTEYDTQEEYVLHKTEAVGTFVGAVREAVQAVLAEIVHNCYDEAVFKTKQTQELIDYVRRQYGDELEFLWKKFPNNAIWRRKDNGKWYGAILTVAGNKLGLPTSEIVEIIDLRVLPDEMAALLMQAGYYPGWHMNKKFWFTVVLDAGVPTEELCRKIDVSYQLARK